MKVNHILRKAIIRITRIKIRLLKMLISKRKIATKETIINTR